MKASRSASLTRSYHIFEAASGRAGLETCTSHPTRAALSKTGTSEMSLIRPSRKPWLPCRQRESDLLKAAYQH